MFVSSPNRLVSNHRAEQVWELIDRIQNELELDDTAFSNLMGLTVQEFKKNRANQVSPSTQCMVYLCEELELSLTHFLNRTIDFTVLKRQFRGLAPQLPKKYSEHAFGKIMTFRAMIQYVSIKNPVIAKWVMDDLQLDRRLLRRAKTPVNILLYEDVSEKMARLGINFEGFRHMGALAGQENFRNYDFSRFTQDRPKSTLLERSLRVIQKFADRNHDYRIESVTSTHALFSCRPTQKIKDLTRKDRVGNIHTSVLKIGMFNQIPLMLDKNAKVRTRMLQSIHQGDSRCLYELAQY